MSNVAHASYTVTDLIDGLQWKGALASAPANPKESWSYYNTTEKKTYIYSNDKWEVMTQDGADGKSVSGITNYYYASTSDKSYPAVGNSKWKTTISQLDAPYNETNKYLWNYEVTSLSNGTSLDPTTPEVISCYGKDGATGKGIKEIKEYYLISNKGSGVGKPTTTPSSNISNVSADTWYSVPVVTTSTHNYLWNCEKIIYDDNKTESDYTVPAIIGVHGAAGSDSISLSLDEDFIAVPCNSKGIIASSFSYPTPYLSIYIGGEKQAINTGSSSNNYYYKKLKITTDGITATWKTSSGGSISTYQGGSLGITLSRLTKDRATVKISLHSVNEDDGQNGSNKIAEVSLEVVKNKQGEDGRYVYILPAASTFNKNSSNRILIEGKSRSGTNAPVAQTGTWSVSGAKAYTTESGTTEVSTSSSRDSIYVDPSGATGNITISFSIGGVVIDKETLIMVQNGEKGDTGTVTGEKVFYCATSTDTSLPNSSIFTTGYQGSDDDFSSATSNGISWSAESIFFGSLSQTGEWDIRQTNNSKRPADKPCVWSITLIKSDADKKWYAAHSPLKVSLLNAATIAARVQVDKDDNNQKIESENGKVAFWCHKAGLSIMDGSTIVAGSIKTAQLEAGAVTADKIKAGTITGTQIAGETITGDKIDVTSLVAKKVLIGEQSSPIFYADGIKTDTNPSPTLKINVGSLKLSSDKDAKNEIAGWKISDNGIFREIRNKDDTVELIYGLNSDPKVQGVSLIDGSDQQAIFYVKKNVGSSGGSPYTFLLLEDGSLYSKAANFSGSNIVLGDTVILGEENMDVQTFLRRGNLPRGSSVQDAVNAFGETFTYIATDGWEDMEYSHTITINGIGSGKFTFSGGNCMSFKRADAGWPEALASDTCYYTHSGTGGGAGSRDEMPTSTFGDLTLYNYTVLVICLTEEALDGLQGHIITKLSLPCSSSHATPTSSDANTYIAYTDATDGFEGEVDDNSLAASESAEWQSAGEYIVFNLNMQDVVYSGGNLTFILRLQQSWESGGNIYQFIRLHSKPQSTIAN